MLEAIVIIVALGGLEIALWWADHKRQAEQLATLEAIWVELALLNEDRTVKYPGQIVEAPPCSASRSADFASSDSGYYAVIAASRETPRDAALGCNFPRIEFWE